MENNNDNRENMEEKLNDDVNGKNIDGGNGNNNNQQYDNVENNSYVPTGNNGGNYDKRYDMEILNSPTIKKFNWGAFADPIFWGIGNKAYLGLLALVPFLNLVWIFVCGFKGNEWAWQAGDYKSLEEFEKVQETWNRSGIARFIVSAVGVVAVIGFWLIAGMFMFASYRHGGGMMGY